MMDFITYIPYLIHPVGEYDHIRGSRTAPLTLVEYGDFQCRHTAQAYPIVRALQAELGEQRLQVVFRHFPRWGKHPHAFHAAEAAESAHVHGLFWEMHDIMLTHHDRLEDQDLLQYYEELNLNPDELADHLKNQTYARIIVDDHKSGIENGVSETPTFFLNGLLYEGDPDLEMMHQMLTTCENQ